MKNSLFITAAVMALGFATPVWSQAEGPAAFTSENAILDTGIPFAIGAREAQQNLRGSFGWSTFQEGLVEGVYFRFDPDGYARFSPSPRLDTDVFEVICRPRTYSCMARKDNLSVIPLNNGKIQLKLEDVRPGDSLFLADASSELQLPERILQPLEFQFETLLSAGGNLIVRRGDKEIVKTSLSGFGAVVPYLRWITARQDYTVLPRNWPVPNAQGSADGAITNATGWASPMPQPQAIQQVGPGAQYAAATPNNGLDQVKDDLQELKSLLAERSNNNDTAVAAVAAAPSPQDRTAQLETAISQLMAEVKMLRQGSVTPENAPTTAAAAPATRLWSDPVQIVPAVNKPADQAQAAAAAPPDLTLSEPMAAQALPSEVDHLNYLINEMGLAPKTAMILMQIVGNDASDTAKIDPIERSYHDSLAMTILNELERDLAASPAAEVSVDNQPLMHEKKMAASSDGQASSAEQGQLVQQLSSENIMIDAPPNMDAPIQDTTMVNVKPESTGPAVSDAKVDLSRDEYQPLTAYFKSVIEGDN